MTAEPDDDDDGRTTISVRLPLPVAVSGAIMSAVDQMWPGSTIGDGPAGCLNMKIDANLRPPADEFIVPEIDDEDHGDVEVLRPGAMRLRPYERFALSIYDGLKPMFDEHPGAINYVEMPLINGVAISVYRHGDAMSPHQLREAAEARVAALEAQLAEHDITPVAADTNWGLRRSQDTWIDLNLARIDELVDAGLDDDARALIAALEAVAAESPDTALAERLALRLGDRKDPT